MLTDTDKKKRQGRITGSTIGVLVGLHKYKTIIDVWRAIVEGLDDVDPLSSDILRGKHLETPIIEWYCERSGETIRPVETRVHPQYSFLAATADGELLRGDDPVMVVEVKAPRFPWDWGEPDTDQIPDYHVPQQVLEMACYDLPATKTLALLNGDVAEYNIQRDLELEQHLIGVAEDFWRSYILTRRPPPPDATKAYGKYLESRYPGSNKEILEADTEQEDLLRLYFEAEHRVEQAEEKKQGLRNLICDAIGGAHGIAGECGKVSWSPVEGRTTVDWKAVAKEAGVSDDLIARHTKQGNGYRRFFPKKAKGTP